MTSSHRWIHAPWSRWLLEQVPRDHRETDAAFAYRRKVVTGTTITGAGLLGASLSTRPGSRAFYGLTLGVATIWTAGGVRSGPLHLGHTRASDGSYRRPVLTPIAVGGAAFGGFYGAALIARKIPLLNHALTDILQYAHEGSDRLVLATTLANGLAEEIFFRGAVYAAIGARQPVARTTAAYVVATATTRNPALVIASAVMGTLFGLQRRASGGIQASTLTHLVWSALMVRFLPPLFRRGPARTTRPFGRFATLRAGTAPTQRATPPSQR